MTTTYISVRRMAIVNNHKYNRRRPVFDHRNDPSAEPTRLAVGRSHAAGMPIEHGPEAIYHGYVRLVYDTENPLSNGAVAWIEITETDPPPATGRVINVSVDEAAPIVDGYEAP